MEIQYNLNDKYMKYYNEANGIGLLKRKLKKNPNIKIKSYMLYITSQFSLYFILWFISTIICVNIWDLQWLLKLHLNIGAFILFIYFIMFLLFFIICFYRKISNREGLLEINEDGILDKLKNGIQVGFSYEQIELVVITDNLIVFLTKIPIMIFIKNEKLEKNKIINKIKKSSNVQIIDKTNN